MSQNYQQQPAGKKKGDSEHNSLFDFEADPLHGKALGT